MITINFTLTYLELYLITINIITFFVYGFDKFQAIRNKTYIWRISELTLLIFVFCGGVIGSFLAMILFRHKIKKYSFMAKYVGIIIILMLLWYLIKNN